MPTSRGDLTTAHRRTVLIVEDHPLTRRGLCDLFDSEADLRVCGEAAEPADALREFRAARPDLVITDLSLRSGHGLELIAALKAFDDDARILVVSVYDDQLFAERCLHAGALGYVNKQCPTTTLLEAVRTVLAGKVFVSPEISQNLLLRVGKRGAPAPSGLAALSDREMQVFMLIGEGRRTREIADTLHVSVKTVETHRDHIKTKLGIDSSANLMRRALVWFHEQT